MTPEQLTEIKKRLAEADDPIVGLVHAHAYCTDIRALLSEIDRLNAERDTKIDALEIRCQDYLEAVASTVEENATLREALNGLTTKIEAVFADPSYQSQVSMAWAHGHRYTGPNVVNELAVAHEALKLPTPPTL